MSSPSIVASATATARHWLLLVALIVTVSPTFLFTGAFNMPKEDPYKVLGVMKKDRNNMDAIKKAYRAKAKAAHPDKNRDIDPEVANDRFHRIAQAWELLSNPQNKKRYDNGGVHRVVFNTSHRRAQQTAAQKRAQELRNREELRKQRIFEKQYRQHAEVAQADVLKVSTLEQLIEANIVDKTTLRFQKHFLCVFVSNKNIEKIADKDYFFPYPFGSSGRNDIDWRPLIQTSKVRFNKATPLTKAFKVPSKSAKPYIVFAKKGARYDSREFKVYKAPDGKNLSEQNKEFGKWVLNQLQTEVTIVNRNPKGGPSIKIYQVEVIADGIWRIKPVSGNLVEPQYQLTVRTKLSDRLIILDATTNEFIDSIGISKSYSEMLLSEDTVDKIAMGNILVEEEGQTIDIGTGYGTTRTCYDLSTKCDTLLKQENCQKLSSFAHAMCPKSCGVCIESPIFNGVYYSILHTPPHRVPPGLRKFLPLLQEAFRFVVTVGRDFSHIWSVRRNVLFGFLAAGILVGTQVILLINAMNVLANTRPTSRLQERTTTSPSKAGLRILVVSTGFATIALFWLSKAPGHEIPRLLRGLSEDLRAMRRSSVDIVLYLFGLGVASLLVSKVLTHKLFRRHDQRWFRYALLLATTIGVSIAMVAGVTYALGNGRRGVKHIRWNFVLEFYKNAAATILGLGHLFGATVLAMARPAKIRPALSWMPIKKHIAASLANIGVGCGLLSLALMDKFFLEDLEHVISMRMSAAIPCLLVGILLGLGGAYALVETVTAAVTKTKSKTVPQEFRQSRDIKTRTD